MKNVTIYITVVLSERNNIFFLISTQFKSWHVWFYCSQYFSCLGIVEYCCTSDDLGNGINFIFDSFSVSLDKKGSEELGILFYTNQLWLLFLQPAIISNVSTGSPRLPRLPVKVQAEVLYNFPIFPAPGVLNCIGRWIFLASEAVMFPLGKPLCTSTPAMKVNSSKGWRGIKVVESSAATPVNHWSFFFVR